MSRTTLVAGNWKMFKLRDEARDFCDVLTVGLDEVGDVDIAVSPPLTALADVAAALVPLGVGVWAQNGHAAASGAFTGEVAMAMLADVGATGVLLGHSERRQLFGETDAALAEKVPAAIAAGLEAVLCVGETAAEREAGETEARLGAQLVAGLSGVTPATAAGLTIAYEPVWAIGTGATATPALAQSVHAFIRGAIAARLGAAAAETLRILYGGSVKPDNAGELLAQTDIDGALVGGASLDPRSLLGIAQAARG